MSEKKINIEVLGVKEVVNKVGSTTIKAKCLETTVKINDIVAKLVNEDGNTWFDTEDYKTVVFPTAESLLEAIQKCYQARKERNTQLVKKMAEDLKEALKIVSKEDLAKYLMYNEYNNDELENLELSNILIDWAEHCFYMNLHPESFVENYYKEIIQDTLDNDLLEIENKSGIVYVDKHKMSEYWVMDWSDGIYPYGLNESMFLYHLTEEEKDKKEVIKGLVKVIEEIIELADILEK